MTSGRLSNHVADVRKLVNREFRRVGAAPAEEYLAKSGMGRKQIQSVLAPAGTTLRTRSGYLIPNPPVQSALVRVGRKLLAVSGWNESGVINQMPLIKVREDESLENALKRFKRKCEKSGILTEIKKRQHYEKPSVRKKRKALAARKKLLKRLAQERRMEG